MFSSRKTTVVAILTAVTILSNQVLAIVDNNPETVFNFNAIIEALGILGIGIFARDNNVTSEKAGAK